MKVTKATAPDKLAARYRMPAEWQRHEATWIGWPHNRTDWPGKITPIQWVYGEIIRRLAPAERLHIIVNSERHETQAQRVLTKAGVDLTRVVFFRFPTNRGWTRDFGPIFVRRRGTRSADPPVGRERADTAIVRFRFNAWAKYSDWQKDDRVPELAAAALGCPIIEAQHDGRGVVLEGGSIDVNGRGTIITTEECLLDPETQTRNPGLSRKDYETVFAKFLGAKHTLWLGRGITGDDTHGHVDDLCRFVNETTVVLCRESDPQEANYAPLAENRERLQGMRLEDGSRIEVVELPMPAPLAFRGQRLPASYANFYIANAAVLVPTFNDVNDRLALGLLGELFTDRPVIGIHAVDLVWGLGTLHCLTQQQPVK
ncbi:MAG TPA: agmatine deiminase family protein [Blastocatellia bacterium]